MLLTALALAAALPPAAATSVTASGAAIFPRQIRDGAMVADLYRPACTGLAPAILLLGGSEGVLGKATAGQARSLAEHGLVVLHVSYFGSPGQSAALKSIPLETFDCALDWLKAQSGVVAERIGIVSTSKGAGAALLVASRRLDLKIAVLGVPSSVVWPDIALDGIVTESSWTKKGKPVPFTPYGWTGERRGIHGLYADALADPAKAATGVIPAEQSRAAIVMVYGEANGLWPPCSMARAVETRLRARRYRHPVTLLAYPDADHATFGPPLDPGSPRAATIGALGGSVSGNSAARADRWPKVLAILATALQPEAGR